MSDNFWRDLVEISLKTEENEMNCGECFELLDQYVDMLNAGQEPNTLLPRLEQHLVMCHCCHAELQALQIAIKTALDMADES